MDVSSEEQGGLSSDFSLEALLSEDFTTLDAGEYQLPPLGELPSLDSILHETSLEDTGSLLSWQSGATSNRTLASQFDGDSVSSRVTPDLCGAGATAAATAADQGHAPPLATGSAGSADAVEAAALVCAPMTGISAQIQSANSRAGAGSATCLSVAVKDGGGGGVATVVAVGTSQGRCLVFDDAEALVLCLGDGNSPSEDATGAVACLHLNATADRLLAGMARGHIFLYDLSQGRLLLSFDECFERGVAVLHIRFSGVLSSVALFSDSGGSVFELSWRRRAALSLASITTTTTTSSSSSRSSSSRLPLVATSRCLFSGSRGEVVTMEPLPPPPPSLAAGGGGGGSGGGLDRGLIQRVVLAMATVSKVIVIVCRPVVVLFTHSLTASPRYPPLLAWQYALIGGGSGVSNKQQQHQQQQQQHPVLTFARQSRLYFYQLVLARDEKVRLLPLMWTQVPCTVQSLHWFHQRSLVLLDTDEQLRLWHVRGNRQLEILDACDVKLVYSAGFFKGLANGGNVSKAMAMVGNKCCYQSVVAACCGATQQQQQRLWLLSGAGVWQVSCRSWLQRLQLLIDRGASSCSSGGGYLAALQLAEQLRRDVLHVLVAEPQYASAARKQQIIGDRMVAIVIEWIESSVGTFRSADHCRTIVPLCVKYLVQLKAFDVLFDRANALFEVDSVAHNVYLESLEPYMVSTQLTEVPPAILKQFVTLYIDTGRAQVLEQCLLAVQLTSIDIDQVLSLCHRHAMYDLPIRIYTEGMADYVTPLVHMLDQLSEFVGQGGPLTDSQARLGHKLLVYVASCLTGRRYPSSGQLPAACLDQVKWHVLSTVTCLHSRRAADSQPLYPYFRLLLTFDTAAFLDVLSLAFGEPEFGSELGMEQRQRLIHTLVSLMVDHDSYTPRQMGALFTFLARQLVQPGNVVSLSETMFNKLVECLTEPGTSARHEQNQQQLLQLIDTGRLDSYCTEHLANRAKRAQMYDVCRLLHERQSEYGAVLHCMLAQPAGRRQAHRYIRARAALPANPLCQPPHDPLSLLLDNLQCLLQVDAAATAALIVQCFGDCVGAAVARLSSHAQLQYQLTSALLAAHCDEAPGLLSQLLLQHVQLMCQLDSAAVLPFLRAHQAQLSCAGIDRLIAVCEQYDCYSGQAWLLELSGGSEQALRLMIDRLALMTRQLCECDLSDSPPVDDINTRGRWRVCRSVWPSVSHQLSTCVQLCVRAHGSVSTTTTRSPSTAATGGAATAAAAAGGGGAAVAAIKTTTVKKEDSERYMTYWNRLLTEAVTVDQHMTQHMTTTGSSRDSGGGSGGVGGGSGETDGVSGVGGGAEVVRLSQLVLAAMAAQVPVALLVQCLVTVPGKASATLTDLRPVIAGMLETYHYERVLLSCTTSLLRRDCGAASRRYCGAVSRAIHCWHPATAPAPAIASDACPPHCSLCHAPVTHQPAIGKVAPPPPPAAPAPAAAVVVAETDCAEHTAADISRLTIQSTVGDVTAHHSANITITTTSNNNNIIISSSSSNSNSNIISSSSEAKTYRVSPRSAPPIFVCRQNHVFHMMCLQSSSASTSEPFCCVCDN